MTRSLRLLGVAALAAALSPARALAVEGVVQINQAAVTSGFPFVISAAGSYRLTSNLTVPDTGTTAISIGSGVHNVEIDLNGFSIAGPNVCTYDTVTDAIDCTFTGGGRALDGALATGVSVRNGVVRGMGGLLIALGDQARVDGIVAVDTRSSAISVGNDSSVANCRISRVTGIGIAALQRATISDNVISRVGAGIRVQSNVATISGNAVSETGGTGILVEGSDAVVTGNLLRDNGFAVSLLDKCVASRNAIFAARVRGISVRNSNVIRENVVHGGLGIGVYARFDNLIARNVLTANADPLFAVEGGSHNALAENLADTTLFSSNPGDTGSGVVTLGGNCCGAGSGLASEFSIPLACDGTD